METTNDNGTHLLTVNAGSSSIKLAVFAVGDPIRKLLEATVDNIGQPSARLVAGNETEPVTAKDHTAAADILARWLMAQVPAAAIVAVGHRLVHGGPNYHESQVVTLVSCSLTYKSSQHSTLH
jgi:acetate kinase